LIAIALAAAAPATAASAAWTGAGTGTHFAKAVSMPAGNTPTASVSNRTVTVSWSASTFPGGTPVAGYVVKRYDTSGNAQTIGSACSGTIAALSCSETAVPGGTWKYSVTPVHGNWTGAESAQSATVTVASPSLSWSGSTNLTSLPGTLSGSLASFVPGQTVTYRLDNPTTGTVLTGTTTPSTIPTGGGASASVTIPAGTSNGSHTVYAVGSGGSDVASASFTVTVQYTATTSAWDLRDASAGGAESNQSASNAFTDTLNFNTGNWPTAFNNSNYVDFNENASLPAGFAVTGANFNFSFAASQAGDTACFWFDVRHASTGVPIASHGSSASPVACRTGTTQLSISTALPELDTTDLANDARIRVYGRNTGARPFAIDLATVSGTQQSTAFTLYPASYTDATSGTPATSVWSLFASGGLSYTSQSTWAGAYSATRYLKLTFPSYVPAGATVSGATFKDSFRLTTTGGGRSACYYLEVFSGGTSIGTHGGSGSPINCNSTSSYVTDTVPLAEINTPARANGAVVKMYFWVTGGGGRTTDHDFAQLAINYQ
jgi:hypothetical protein